jgi:hypothetical protein
MGNFEKLGALKVTEAVPFPAVAVPIVGALAGPLVDPEADPKIGIFTYLVSLLAPY